MLYFDTETELIETILKIPYFSKNELTEWEETNGYKSIELEAERLYSLIDPEGFTDLDGVKMFVEKNNKYFQLIEEDNGEYTLETKNYNNPWKYLVNEDNMFQVGSKLYKVYSNSLLLVDESKIDQIKNVDLETAVSIEGALFLGNNMKSALSDCGTHTVDRHDDGRERIKLEMWAKSTEYGNCWLAGSYFEATAYRLIWPIWYRKVREITVSIDNTTYIYEAGNLEVRERIQTTGEISKTTDFWHETPMPVTQIMKPCGEITASFGNYDSWAKQDEASGQVSLICP